MTTELRFRDLVFRTYDDGDLEIEFLDERTARFLSPEQIAQLLAFLKEPQP